MPLNRNGLYIFLIISCIAGYIWLFINYSAAEKAQDTSIIGVCIIKNITSIPCPSCGTTRALNSLLHGDFHKAIYTNPLCLILASLLLIIPIWIAYDTVKRENSLLHFYSKTEVFLRQKYVAIPAILVITANWIWNIYKGL